MEAPLRALLAARDDLPEPAHVWIAYSGGRDSSVLLHAAAAARAHGLPGTLHAVHVDHGLHPDAHAWRAHCLATCRDLGVPCTARSVDARPARGASPEAAAREARYAALAQLVGPGDWLLTAHHRDDQAETLLLQLLRGAGVAGLAAMPARAPFAAGWLLRPLLALGRADLAAYAARHRLAWCDDPDNAATARDRNYLRHAVLPVLAARWPAAADALARSAGHCAEAAQLLDGLAAADLSGLADPAAPARLPLAPLRALSAPRRRLLLRHWLARHGLRPPGRHVLARVDAELLAAAPDRNPVVAWPGGELRRYRDALLLCPPAAPAPPAGAAWPWDPTTPLHLPGGTLRALPATGTGLAVAALAGRPLTVRFRRGGERLRLPGGRTRALKKLLQESGLPPWQRGGLPLVYAGDALAAVADRWVAAEFAASGEAPGWRLEWLPGTATEGAAEAPGGAHLD